ncbi:putative structural protein [Shewanella phage X14]|uniref:Coil containing protein n=1 Tax=Shewanella phage X14 TaxID=2576871 RepID=A0A4P8NE39_9CAUD|nr:putative structural protein [Shewanella phage X14]QCQ65280.1 putative structural protein [Shewanella phage X14]
MSVVAAAVVGSAVVGGVSAYQSGKSQEKAAKSAAASQEAIADENVALQRELAEQQREDFAPWRDIGEQALNQLWSGVQSGEFEVGDIDVTKDPGYQFRMDQGVEALDKSAAARGRLLSGAQQKGVTDYSQNVASQEYANAYAREANEKARKYNMLSGLSSGGQASAAGQAQATSQLGQQTSNILSNLGQSQAQSQYAQGQARAGAYQGMAQAGNQAAQNWLMYKTLGAS